MEYVNGRAGQAPLPASDVLASQASDAAWVRTRRQVRVGDDFVQVPFPRVVSASERPVAAAIESYKREAAVVDGRLSREVTVEQKGSALADLCDGLRTDTGIQLVAGQSVADEKVTLFCRKVPLREVMRQLSRPFGYTWLRSGKTGDYRYELVQDLRSQLLEEELRNRDRNEALLALDREIQRYRPYLGLTPDEALARSKTASPEEKRLLDQLARTGWGPMQMYSRLSRQDLAALRAGQALTFSQEPKPGEKPLPPDLARGVLECNRGWRLVKGEKGFGLTSDLADPRAVPLTADPDARAKVALWISQSELGVFTLDGVSGAFPLNSDNWGTMDGTGTPLAVGMSPAVLKPDNAAANAKLTRDPALRPRVTLQLEARSSKLEAQSRSAATPSFEPDRVPAHGADGGRRQERVADAEPERPEPKVTSADALEALYRATGTPIVSDYYTRLYKPATLVVRNMSLFDALNHLADTTRSRWSKGDAWLQFRSTSFYDDRLKEVPNRLLAHWAASRREHGSLTLEDLVEIAQLPDAQLDASDMAEGARELWGLAEWDLSRSTTQRPHLRYLAQFTPAQRQEAMTPAGLPFARMNLAQQQRYISLAFHAGARPLESLDELEGAVLRVDYKLPGWFEWRMPTLDALEWVVPLQPGREGRRALRPSVRERTREATLQAVRRFDPWLREAMAQAVTRADPRLEAAARSDEQGIAPTRRSLTIIYIPGLVNNRPIHVLRAAQDLTTGTGW
jgi:hypothetical protein